MAIVPGDKAAHKRLTYGALPFAAPPAGWPRPRHLACVVSATVAAAVAVAVAAAVAVAVATVSSGGGGCGDGGGTGFFPGSIECDDFSPCQRWLCRTFKIGEDDVLDEDVLEECGQRVIRHGFEVRHSPLVGSWSPALQDIVVRMEVYATDAKVK